MFSSPPCPTIAWFGWGGHDSDRYIITMFDIIMCSSATTCQLQHDPSSLGEGCGLWDYERLQGMQYHKALIKVPLKKLWGTLFGAKKLLRILRGAPCLERRLRIRAQLRPFQSDLQWPSYNRPRWRCRMQIRLEVPLDCCRRCEQSRNFSTTVDELVVLKVARVGCQYLYKNRKCPSKNSYVAEGRPC